MKDSQIIVIRKNCLSNASDLILAAVKMKELKLHHIQYHLSTMALEEIGKSELIVMQHVTKKIGASDIGAKTLDDHVKKLFWAMWGISFGKRLLTKSEIDDFRGMATTIHNKRMDSLYTDPNQLLLAKDNVSINESDNLLSLADARLGMELAREPDFDRDEKDKEVIHWFLEATEDPTKRGLIFGGSAHKKLIELKGNGREWIIWLKKQFDDNDLEIRKIIGEELARKKPVGKDAEKPKYQIKVKIKSDSHSIRNSVLNEWNKHVSFINLTSDDEHNLFCTFTFSKKVPPTALWSVSWGTARTFVTSLNISTFGFFWWNIQKDISIFYSEAKDLERNIKLEVKPEKALSLNWKELKWTLKSGHLAKASMIFAFMTDNKGNKIEKALEHYVLGLTLVAKNDIHLRLEASAFREFFEALKIAISTSQEWNADIPFIDVLNTIFKEKDLSSSNLDEYVRLGEQLSRSNSMEDERKIVVTLTEVFGIKLYADQYFQALASKWANEHKNLIKNDRR